MPSSTLVGPHRHRVETMERIFRGKSGTPKYYAVQLGQPAFISAKGCCCRLGIEPESSHPASQQHTPYNRHLHPLYLHLPSGARPPKNLDPSTVVMKRHEALLSE